MDDLFSRLREGEHELHPVASDEDVHWSEAALGRSLPPTYTSFVTRFSNGAYLYSLEQVNAVGPYTGRIGTITGASDADFDPDGLVQAFEGGLTVSARDLVPFHADHNANNWCFITTDSTQDGEYPVGYFDGSSMTLYGLLPGFRDWLERLVTTQNDVIESMYSRDFLEEVVGLG